MKCWACCNASKYDIEKMSPYLKEKGIENSRFDEFLFFTEVVDKSPRVIFYFAFGVVVLWNVPVDMRTKYMDLAAAFKGEPSHIIEKDLYEYSYGEKTQITHKAIILENKDPMLKLSICFALAQSAKLAYFEEKIAKVIESSQHIPVKLAETGKQPYSRKELHKMTAQLYIERSSINLHYDLLDEPDFFWDYEVFEPHYSMAVKYFDIQDRISVLNQKLQVVSELYEILNQELRHNHSSRLEWIIIWLIGMEIALPFIQKIPLLWS